MAYSHYRLLTYKTFRTDTHKPQADKQNKFLYYHVREYFEIEKISRSQKYTVVQIEVYILIRAPFVYQCMDCGELFLAFCQ